jgi:hypothetical protein
MDQVDSPMSQEGQGGSKDRAEALRRLANEGQAKAASAASAQSSVSATLDIGLAVHAHPATHRWRFWVVGVLVVALAATTLAVMYFHARPATTASKPLHPIVFTPVSDQVDCLTDMAWSSDFHMIAALGYSGGCPFPMRPYDANYEDISPALYQGPLSRVNDGSGAVAIYDAQHGVRISEFAPDSAIFKAILNQEPITSSFRAWLAQADLSPPGNFAINYTHILWASGNQRVILVFNFYLPDGAPISTAEKKELPGHIIQGLLITDLAGQHPQVLLHAGGQQADGAVIWDLTAGRSIGSETPSAPFALQPAALTYSWTSAGALSPGQPLTFNSSTAASESSPVGAPLAGAPSFSIWQPGSITTTFASHTPGVPNLTGVVAFTTDFAAFSPDGRYLATSVGLAGLVVAPQGATDPTLSNATLARYGWQPAPRLPLRDAGLRAAIELAEENDGQTPGVDTSVAWRPDGREIAVSAFTKDGAVKIFDTSTGKQLGSLVPPAIAVNNANPESDLLVWSTDGRSLAYYNGSTVSIWSGPLLPA